MGQESECHSPLPPHTHTNTIQPPSPQASTHIIMRLITQHHLQGTHCIYQSSKTTIRDWHMSQRRRWRKVNEASNWMSPPSNPYLPLYAITCPCCSVSWVTPDQHCLNIFILLFHGNNVTKVKSPRMDESKGMSWVEFNLKRFSLSRESEFNLALLQGWRDCRQIPYLHWIIFNYILRSPGLLIQRFKWRKLQNKNPKHLYE